jgi:Zinc finger, C3HC4 type (RING finger)/U11-48K-like CHHC zinc finger
MNKLEIDRFDYTVCPFNSSHRFSAEQYKFHVLRCKDRNFPNVSNSVQKCPHNSSHLYTQASLYEYHVPRCLDYQGREKYILGNFGEAPTEIQYKDCPYNRLHGIKQGENYAYQVHIENCPNKISGPVDLSMPTPSLDKTYSGQLNYSHGLISTNDVSLTFSTPVYDHKPINNQVTIHFCSKPITVYKENIGAGLEDNDIWICHITHADAREWPGLKFIEDNRSQKHYLTAVLHPDQSQLNLQRYNSFVKMLTISDKNSCAISVSYQNTSDKNLAIFIIHKSEETGFGNVIENSELGVFCIPHSMLYNKPSIISSLQNSLSEKESEINEILNNYNKLLADRDRIVENWNSIKIELENFKIKAKEIKDNCDLRILNKEKEVSDIKNSAFLLINEVKDSFEAEKASLNQKIERIEREKESSSMNFQSDLQNVKTTAKFSLEKITQKNYELIKEVERAKKDVMTMAKQINEKDNEIHKLKDNIQRLEEQKSMFLSKDNKIILEEAIKMEKEKISSMQQEKEYCTICFADKKNTIFIPCGHLAYCIGCLSSIKIEIGKKISVHSPYSACPICEKTVQKVQKAYAY